MIWDWGGSDGGSSDFNIGLSQRMLRQHPLHTTVSLFF